MNLFQIRKKLVQLSGRYDLVVDTNKYEDNGANFFIDSGQKMLDGLIETPNKLKEFSRTISEGDFEFVFTDVRGVKAVAIEDDEGIRYLDKVSLKDIRETYGNESNFDNADTDIPEAYALGYTRVGLKATEISEGSKRLFILPPANKEYTIRVLASYFSPALVEDSDVSFWSLFWADILIQAALYKAEVFHRNRSGSADWFADIQRSAQKIEFDMIEEEIAEIDQMDNSWNWRNALPRKSYEYEYRFS